MQILILQGPNINLLGFKSSKIEEHLTLGKLNKEIRLVSKNHNVDLKFLQTHKSFQAVNFLQRNRRKANGLLFTPSSWARNNYTILETVNLIDIKTSVVYFDEPYSFGTTEKESIFRGPNTKSFTGKPISASLKGMEYLLNQ